MREEAERAGARCAAEGSGASARRRVARFVRRASYGLAPCAVACTLALASLVAGTAHAGDARSFALLHVEANEGGASGGHVALRFDDEVFHFQHEPNGRLRLFRDDASSFEHAYARVGNRRMHVLRVTAERNTVRALRDALALRRNVDDALDEHAAALARTLAWIEAARGEGEPPALRGLGLFAWDAEEAADAPGSEAARAAIRRVSERIEAAGGGGIASRRAEAERALRDVLETSLAAFEPELAEARAAEQALDRLPAFAATRAEAIERAWQRVAALRALETAPALATAAWLRDDGLLGALAPAERASLAAAADRLEPALVALVDARRSDAGEALLVGLARLAALRASVASGRVRLLDAIPESAPHVPIDGPLRAPYLDALERASRRAFEHVRDESLARNVPSEIDLAALEASAARWIESRRACDAGAALRAHPGSPTPARAGRPNGVALPLAPEAALAAARKERDSFERALDRRAGYDLVRRNCVTELFRVIDDALVATATSGPGATARGDAAARDEALDRVWQQRLGGRVDASAGLRFIPVVAAQAFAEQLPAVSRVEVPSEREAALARLRAHEPAWRVALRESNALTATLHRPGFGDSSFLFYTSDAPWLGPLLGSANLVWAGADAALGLLSWPVEGARRLDAGVRGVLYSLPELGFVPLRKGSFAWVDADAPE